MLKTSLSTALAFGFALAAASAQTASAPAPRTFGFVTHASFYSLEAKEANLIDPQAFVVDPAALAGPGPQGIVHAAGVRPAYRVDDPATPVVNAQGIALGFTLGAWFGARGSATLNDTGPATVATCTFTGLVPNGRYSLFENHFEASGVTFTPLDGTGAKNSFTAAADGRAAIEVAIPGGISHAEGLLLIYHSDGLDHGLQRGQPGLSAHHQLVIRVP